MKSPLLTWACLLATALMFAVSLNVAAEDEPAEPKMVKIGDEQFRIGTITVDRKAQTFSVPGKILVLKDALEYLAVSKDGMKGYESLLELETSPREFNLACILIGLDDEKSEKPRYQFDDRKPQGQAVAISVSWEEDGKTVSVSGANAMTAGDDMFDDDSWVYIGSTTQNYGKEFMADVGGTLIGFVHDPNSIIEHINGGGIGAYGLITGNEDLLPPKDSAITLTITVVAD
jgi:hypothetical protein